jgi:broad specificity phosphatase PhoE
VLILVRHGRTTANARSLLVGHLDVPLDERGVEQAALVGKALTDIDRVVSSPLQRCRQTAEALGQPFEVDERWIELDYGEFDGQPLASIGRAVWDEWRADPSYVPAGGESLAALAERVSAACDDLVTEALERNIVVVSHVSPIKAAAAWALAAGVEIAWRSHIDQASITRVSMTSTGPVLRSFNETAHLNQ